MPRRVTATILLLTMLPGAAAAQPAPAPAASPPAEAQAGEADCGARAALYEGPHGFKLWALRRGALSRDNPLRPVADAPPYLVLEVNIGGRSATAYGPDFDALLRGGSPAQLEASLGSAIDWAERPGKLPPRLQIVGDDGAPLAALSFKECGSPRRAAPAKARVAPKPQAPPAERGARREPERALPQGALPGLELPR